MRLAAAFATILALAAVRAHAGTPEPGFADDLYVGGLSAPTAVAFLPDGRLVITEKGGAVRLWDGSTLSTLGTIPVCGTVEMGLLGIAIDPAFTTNGFIYLYRTKPGTPSACSTTGRFNEVVRVTMTGGSIGSLTTLVTGMRTDNGNHDGGVLRIGPDGKLYVGVGDTGLGDNVGGPGTSTNPYSQDLAELEGKVLRLELDGSVPADNPFVATPGARGEVFALGFRNPFRMTFEPMTGALWLADVGDLTVEEVDIVTSGGNYAWPHCEATLPSGCEQPGDIDPIFSYLHGGAGSLGSCIIGGSFAGAAFGALAGQYVFGDCISSNVYLATLNAGHTNIVGTPALASSAAGVPADFVTGPDGAVYYVAEGAGEVRRMSVPTAGADQPILGTKLQLRAPASTATKKKLSFLGKDPSIALGAGNGSTDDPVLNGGSLHVVGAGLDETYALPASGWSYLGLSGANVGYLYKDKGLVNGPIGSVQVKRGKLAKANGSHAGLGFDLAGDPRPVTVVLQTGSLRYCAEFGGTSSFSVGKLTAKNAPAPSTCP